VSSYARGEIFRIYTKIYHFRPRVQFSVKNEGMAEVARETTLSGGISPLARYLL
jgi:hypothetical protein